MAHQGSTDKGRVEKEGGEWMRRGLRVEGGNGKVWAENCKSS
jgi:hypothetical protein